MSKAKTKKSKSQTSAKAKATPKRPRVRVSTLRAALVKKDQETDRYRAAALAALGLLKQVQKKRLYEPNSDHHDYCPDCGRSPYNEPSHSVDCLVPKIRRVLGFYKDILEGHVDPEKCLAV